LTQTENFQLRKGRAKLRGDGRCEGREIELQKETTRKDLCLRICKGEKKKVKKTEKGVRNFL